MSVTATEAALTDAAASRSTLVIACAGALLALLNFTMPLPILPAISASLGAGPAEQTWILSGISLSIASLLLISGRLADDHGRKRVFVAGLVVFLAASVGCAAAPGPAAFIAGRVLQAIGTAAVLARILGLLAAAFRSGSARTHATGLWGAMIGGGVALGPLAGALLVAWS